MAITIRKPGLGRAEARTQPVCAFHEDLLAQAMAVRWVWLTAVASGQDHPGPHGRRITASGRWLMMLAGGGCFPAGR
jgi:hypothetical protein